MSARSGASRPILAKATEDGLLSTKMPAPMAAAMRAAAGAELGVVLGWMSTPGPRPSTTFCSQRTPTIPGDLVYYVGPNVISLERQSRGTHITSSASGSPFTS